MEAFDDTTNESRPVVLLPVPGNSEIKESDTKFSSEISPAV